MPLSLKIADLFADVEVRTAKFDAQMAALQAKLGSTRLSATGGGVAGSTPDQLFPLAKLQAAGLKYQDAIQKAGEKAATAAKNVQDKIAKAAERSQAKSAKDGPQFIPLASVQLAGVKYAGEIEKAAAQAQKAQDKALAAAKASQDKAAAQNAAWQAKEVARIRAEGVARAKAAEEAGRLAAQAQAAAQAEADDAIGMTDRSLRSAGARPRTFKGGRGGKGGGKGLKGLGGKLGGMNLSAIAGTLDDLQYVDLTGRAGLGPILNNLLQFSPILAIVGLATQQLIVRWGGLMQAMGVGLPQPALTGPELLAANLKKATTEMEDLAEKSSLTWYELAKLNKLRDDVKVMEARQKDDKEVEGVIETQSSALSKQGDAFKEAVGAVGGSNAFGEIKGNLEEAKNSKGLVFNLVTRTMTTPEQAARDMLLAATRGDEIAAAEIRKSLKSNSAFGQALDAAMPTPTTNPASLSALQGVMSRFGLTADRMTDEKGKSTLQFGMHGSSPLANGLGQALMGGLGGGLLGTLPGLNQLSGGKLGEVAAMALSSPKEKLPEVPELRLGTSGADFGRNLQADIFRQAGRDETEKNTETTARNTGEMLDILRQGAKNVVGAILG